MIPVLGSTKQGFAILMQGGQSSGGGRTTEARGQQSERRIRGRVSNFLLKLVKVLGLLGPGSWVCNLGCNFGPGHKLGLTIP
ncbi:hypothetical protein E1A91_D10G094900v1 [Gossypium mustelinum]|uniref:Uncharacterized protein n=1 Tax=Gossypium mustelinum TaxID=34275 RepID=A0A5D2T5A6_GOSMU|nr:hypothetical protein E1A91_D10G094900v1 [Gossypium mustelinum]